MKPSFVRWMAVPVVLAELGYRPRDFAAGTGWLLTLARAALTLGLALLGGVFFLSRRATHRQRQQLIRLLEAARTGQPLHSKPCDLYPLLRWRVAMNAPTLFLYTMVLCPFQVFFPCPHGVRQQP